MELFKLVKAKSQCIIQNCLIISTVSVVTWMTISAMLKRKNRNKLKDSQCINNETIPTPLIVITGCDSGLGYSIVMRYLNGEHLNVNQNNLMNLQTYNYNKLIIPYNIAIVAFCLNPNGPGAKRLRSLKNSNIQLFVKKLDLTNIDSIKKSAEFVNTLLKKTFEESGNANKISYFKYELHALINNAARMVMAEYEWQTVQLIQQQIEVNFLGPIMLTAQLMPNFRKYKSRVINIISHCAYLPLPGLSLYGATKAALHAWTVGSRVELEYHGVRMIMFSPGSFYLHSSIMDSKQRNIAYNQMREHMSNEQLAYYGVYFDAYQNYLSSIDAYICNPEKTIPNTSKIYSKMDHALWAIQPSAEYNVTEPWRYRIYFTLAWTLSVVGLHFLRDKVVRRFVVTPQFQNYTESLEKNT